MPTLTAYIKKYPEIGLYVAIVSCISNIKIINEEAANKIVNCLNPKLREELQIRIPYLKKQIL